MSYTCRSLYIVHVSYRSCINAYLIVHSVHIVPFHDRAALVASSGDGLGDLARFWEGVQELRSEGFLKGCAGGCSDGSEELARLLEMITS